MAKNRKKPVNRAPHATSKDEVIQQMREKAAASRPPLTEEEQLTVEKARELLKEKEAILSGAQEEKAGLEAEIEKLKAERTQVEASYSGMKESLMLDAEARGIIEQRDALLRSAEEQAAAILRDAEEQLARRTSDAEAEAAGILSSAKAQAEDAAREILQAAREEERIIIESKERTANLRAEAILARAGEYEARTHQAADQYEQQIREAAHRSAEEIVANIRAIQMKRGEELDRREIALAEREAGLPGQAEKLAEDRLSAQRTVLNASSERLAALKTQLAEKEEELRFQEDLLKEAQLQQAQRVEELVTCRYTDLQNGMTEMRNMANRLREENRQLHQKYNELILRANQIRDSKGGKDLVEEAEKLREENNRLLEDLRLFRENGITRERITEITHQKTQIEDLQTQCGSLAAELNAAKHQAAMNSGSSQELLDQRQRVASLKEINQELLEELSKRKLVSREDMLRPIQEAPVLLSEPAADLDPEDLADEEVWLEHIRIQSGKSGITFQERQLMAYHTALKIGEWSPLVVLSGVSGTGKSELPKQYAMHGGMQFLSLPVKPDWDSPASLFGYYNSIENKFEATELVRALYQMQRTRNTPWSKGMLMVLLDEMNLAHPEQYFADLLSKFEEARNSDKDPAYEIALGAGERPELLSIGRNVLWTGTMNEDETTKGLSDKVIDRSMLITFPTPRELYSRDERRIEKPMLTLSYERWDEWKKQALHEDQLDGQLTERRKLLERINLQMSAMGRNLGHRVWQSIQNYILNYPTVIAAAGGRGDMEDAVQTAFCDALALKMMPKLRGLEIRGENEGPLEQIRKCLAEGASELCPDFESACRLTSEIFQWHTAAFMGL